VNASRYRVLLVASHPIQYAAPLFRLMAQHPRLDVQVAYCSLQGVEPGVDSGFGVEISWDVPLLDGYPWVHVPNVSPRPGLGRFLGLINPKLWGLLRSGSFDAVVAYTGYAYASFWIAAAAAKIQGTPILFGTDATSLRSRSGKPWKLWLKRFVVPRIFAMADVVIVPSTATKELIRGLGIPDRSIVLTPFVTDNEWWQRRLAEVNRSVERSKCGIPEDACVVLFCAKMQPWKRPADVLRAFAKANVPNAYLVFAGDGPLRTQLEGEAKALAVSERVRFLGFVNQSRLPAVYATCDLLVLPSDYEPCAVVVVEALACGRPVIVSDDVWRGRQDVVRRGETGFTFRTGDVEGLTNIFRVVLKDRERLELMGRAALERMQTWSPQDNIEALVNAVERALSLRSGRH